MKTKDSQDLWEDLTLIEKIDHILVEYAIPKKAKYPFTEWVQFIAWELKTTIEDVENGLKKIFVN